LRRLGTIALVCVGLVIVALTVAPLEIALLVTFGDAGFSDSVVSRILAWVPIVAAIVIGLWLIRSRDRLAVRWFDDSPADLRADSRGLLRLAVLVVGIVLIARGIPSLVSGLASGVQTWSESSGGFSETHLSWVWGQALFSSAAPFVELVVGALLIAYSARIAGRLWAPRGGPTSTVAEAISVPGPEHEATDGSVGQTDNAVE
jgi:hypothetical protein